MRDKLIQQRKLVLVGLAIAGSSVAGLYFWQRAGGLARHGAQLGSYSINHFIDGDTISVNMDGATQTVRFIGVDTPETHKPNTPVQCFGPQAAAFTQKMIGGGRVRLVADGESENRDRYGRLLRYVLLPDGRNLDQLLVQDGYGFAYVQFPFGQATVFMHAQQSAATRKVGLWRACHPFQESGGRWQTPAIDSS